MKITGVSFFQGVRIDGKVETFVQPGLTSLDPSNRAKGLAIEETANGVLIKKGKVATLATWNNVQCITYEELGAVEDALAKEVSKRAK